MFLEKIHNIFAYEVFSEDCGTYYLNLTNFAIVYCLLRHQVSPFLFSMNYSILYPHRVWGLKMDLFYGTLLRLGIAYWITVEHPNQRKPINKVVGRAISYSLGNGHIDVIELALSNSTRNMYKGLRQPSLCHLHR